MEFIKDISVLSKKSAVGGKAQNLAILMETGLDVPKWVVIPAEILLEIIPQSIDHSDKELIFNLIDNFIFPDNFISSIADYFPEKTFFAVRSSALDEDGNNYSFAGQFESFLYVTKDHLEQKIKEFGSASWLDICCGKGNALIQTAEYLSQKGLLIKTKLQGIDLLDFFAPKHSYTNNIEFFIGSMVDWKPDSTYDLITCSHGLHYIGDKLHVIEAAIGALNTHGLFIANMDLNNINITEHNAGLYIKKLLKLYKIDYNSRTKI